MGKWVSIYRDILHIYFSPYYRHLAAREFDKISPKGNRKRFKILLKIGYIRMRQLFKPDLSMDDERKAFGKIWIYASSKNNRDAIEFVHHAIEESVFVVDKKRKEFEDYRFVVPNLRYQFFFLFKFLFLFPAFVFREGYYGQRISNVIFRSIGFYEEWLRLLNKFRPKLVVFANDHNIESRSLLLAAKRLGVRTVYVQHASISPSFPPLKFDLSLLEGEDAYQKYREVGEISGRVELVGMPKFDRYLAYRKSVDKIRHIGIPYNLNDNRSTLAALIMALNQALPDGTITVRRHPKDKTMFSFAEKFDFVKESDPAKESAFDFLIYQDCIIAGNSSIHLESTLLNIPSIYFNSDRGAFINDYYGYVKNGLVDSASDIESLISMILQDPTWIVDRATYYNAVVGTKWEGRSQELALRHLVDFVRLT